MAARCFLLLALVASPTMAAAMAQRREGARMAANPIRKVVNMLQAMQKKVEAEGEKEKELFEKFMCYCKTGGQTLKAGMEAAGTKMPQLEADIEAATEKKAQTEADLKQAQVDRSAAKTAIAEATALREKEAAAYADEKAEAETNIAAINKAVGALEKGMAGAFLQTTAAKSLQNLAANTQVIMSEDRRELLAFLQGSQGDGYAPSGGEVTGILKTMGSEMEKGLADATTTEEAAIASFEQLVAAKKKEIEALSEQIETKMPQIGELGVSIETMKADLGDTAEGLAEDKKFLANLEKECSTKQAEWDERVKTRQEEVLALADTIKILNDDDALELFKKTLPGASSSFVQVKVTSAMVRASALAALQGLHGRPQIDFIALALRGKKVGFGKVIKMIDAMVATLEKEQVDDDSKQEYCEAQFDMTADKKKEKERFLADTEIAIETAKEGIATLTEEIAALEDGIKALDKQVAEATEQRKEESAEYNELMASNGAAKELLGFAKNRLNKFYNPKLYKPEGGAAVLVEVNAHEQSEDAPPPPPETFGAYSKKSEESTGVIAMVDLLVADLDKEMIEAKTAEKDAQKDYETMMADSKEKRAQDSKALTEKVASKADLEADLEAHTDDKKAMQKKLYACLQYIAGVHAECDWLMEYYEVRKEARTAEIDSLTKAKAVLSGADFSF